MKTVPGGRFCSSCQRTLVDLRDKSNEEISALIQDRGKLCGVVAPSQMRVAGTVDLSKQTKPWRNWLLGMYAFVAALLISPTVAKAQSPEVQTETTLHPKRESELPAYDTNHRNPSQGIEIKGVVIDEDTGEPIPFCNIVSENKQYGAVSDFDGVFSLTLTEMPDVSELQFIVSTILYDTANITISQKQLAQAGVIDLGEIKLREDQDLMTGIVIIHRTIPLIGMDPPTFRLRNGVFQH